MFRCADDEMPDGSLHDYYSVTGGYFSMKGRSVACSGRFLRAVNAATEDATLPFPRLADLNAASERTTEERHTLTQLRQSVNMIEENLYALVSDKEKIPMLWSGVCDPNAPETAEDTTLVRRPHLAHRTLYETALRAAHGLALLLDKADSEISDDQFKEKGLKGKLRKRHENFPELYSIEEQAELALEPAPMNSSRLWGRVEERVREHPQESQSAGSKRGEPCTAESGQPNTPLT